MRLQRLPVLTIDIQQVPSEIGEPRQFIFLELLKERCSGTITLRFTGVQDLKIESIQPDTLCHLEIVSVAAEQFEGVRFQVFNDEQDFVLSFYCFDFEINDLAID